MNEGKKNQKKTNERIRMRQTLRRHIRLLFSIKAEFYHDYAYSKTLNGHPDPINHINDAIGALECAEREIESAEWDDGS